MFRQAAPPLAVPPVPQAEANPGTVGTAADWMLRFLLHPRPSLAVPRVGAVLCRVEDPQPDMETLGMLGRDGGMLPSVRDCRVTRPGRRIREGPG